MYHVSIKNITNIFLAICFLFMFNGMENITYKIINKILFKYDTNVSKHILVLVLSLLLWGFEGGLICH